MSDRFDLQASLRGLGLHLDPGVVSCLRTYLDLLVLWNRKTNLVGPRGHRTIFDTLIADSLYLPPFLGRLDLPSAPLCLDLGAGAGLPGIPLRCCWTRGEYHLVEVREKRCVFMRLAAGRLRLPRTHVLQARAEDALARIRAQNRDQRSADLIISRAFMPWDKLLPFVRPMLAPGGRVVVLALEEPPARLPQGWELLRARSYEVRQDGGTAVRWFWGLTPDGE